MSDPIEGEVSLDRRLVLAIATTRCFLALANFGVVLLDQSVPRSDQPIAVVAANVACGIFLAYAVLIRVGLGKGVLSLSTVDAVTPTVDVACALLLVLVTDGYASPFNIWFVLAVLATSGSSRPQRPLTATAMALMAQFFLASVPQIRALEPGTFIVRTIYLIGVCAMVAVIVRTSVQQRAALAAVERFARTMSAVGTLSDAGDELARWLSRVFRIQHAQLAVGQSFYGQYGNPSQHTKPTVPIVHEEISLQLFPDAPLTDADERLIRIALDRFVSTCRRIELTDRLIAAAGTEERLRVADEIHDGLIQQLTAINLYAESARVSAEPGSNIQEELGSIKALAKSAISDARQVLLPPQPVPRPSVDQIVELLQSRWEGPLRMRIPHSISLPEDGWRLAEMMVREGTNNAKRHSNASEISFTMDQVGEWVSIALLNDGTSPREGFDDGYGLRRLREAAAKCGGTIKLTPGANEGAMLVALVPAQTT